MFHPSMDSDPEFGDTTRYYEILFCGVCVSMLLVVPPFYYELYRSWQRMRKACTAEGGYVQKVFFRGMYVNIFWWCCSYLWPVPTSLSLITAHGGGPSLSGAYVGMAVFGAPTIVAARFYGPMSRWDWNVSTKVYYAMALVGYIGITVLSCCPPFTGSIWCLIGAHAIRGLGVGFYLMKARELISAAINSDDLQSWILSVTIFGNLGLASGPIFGSLSVPVLRTSLKISTGSFQDLTPAAYANIVLLFVHAFVFMPVAFATLPLRLHKAGVDTEDESAELYVSAPDRIRRVNAAIAVSCVLFKDAVSSAIETFDVLMLEVEYGWAVEASGFFAGTAMLIATVPLTLYAVLENNIPKQVNIWIHRSSFLIFVICSFGAFPGVCPFSSDPSCELFMWIFRVVNYAFWGIGMSFIEGGFFRWASQDESKWCSFKNFAFCYTFLVEGITRMAGPVMVRSFYEHGGRFAACTLLTSCELFVFVVVFLGLVWPYGKYWS